MNNSAQTSTEIFSIMGMELPQQIRSKIPFGGLLFSPIQCLSFLDAPIPIGFSKKPKRKMRSTPVEKSSSKPIPKKEKQVANRVFTIEGRVESGASTSFSINRIDFATDSNTFMVGTLELGSYVRVSGRILPNGEHRARQVTVLQTN